MGRAVYTDDQFRALTREQFVVNIVSAFEVLDLDELDARRYANAVSDMDYDVKIKGPSLECDPRRKRESFSIKLSNSEVAQNA